MTPAVHELVMLYRPMSQMFVMAVLPNLERRRRTGAISGSGPLHVHRYQVLFPHGADPVVQINDEVRLIATTIATRPINAGDLLTVSDFDIENTFLELPQIDGQRVAFYVTQSYFLSSLSLFDFSPNAPDGPSPGPMRYPVLYVANARGAHATLKPEAVLKALKNDNWPPGRFFFPQVLDLMATGTPVGSTAFVDAVRASYSKETWQVWCEFWEEIKAFPSRLAYVRHSVDRFFAGDYISAVRTIVPEFEAVMREHLALSGVKVPRKAGQVVPAFRRLIMSRPIVLFSPELIETILAYIESELLEGTETIADPQAQVSRHGVLHGIFSGSEDEVMALKYLVLFDALALIIFHDRLVTGRLS